MAYARARSRFTCVRLPTKPTGMAARSSASPVWAAVRGSPSLSDAAMAWMATLTGPNAVPMWFASPIRSAMPRAVASSDCAAARSKLAAAAVAAARRPRARRESSGTGPDRERVDDLAPRWQPALVRRVRVEQHPHAHAAQRRQARGERRMAGELRLAVRHHHDRDAVTGHLAQQAHREVIRVAVGELVHAVERQRAR